MLMSLAFSLIGLECLRIWLGVWQTIRVGNGHIGTFRLSMYNFFTTARVGMLFGAGVLLFWIVSARSYWFARSSDDLRDDSAPFGILLPSPTSSD
jgi:hypothetical protein